MRVNRSDRGMLSLLRLITLLGRVRTWLFTLAIRGGFRQFGRGSRVAPPFRFSGLADVAIGDGVTINRDGWIHTQGAPRSDGGPKVEIGARCSIGMGVSIAATGRVVLGERVLLARNVYISDHGHNYRDVALPVADQGVGPSEPVHIGAGAWIGQNVCILPGVTIGRQCVVGANAVVTADIPDGCVAAGVPAKVIRRYDAATAEWVTAAGPTVTGSDAHGTA